MSNQPEALLSRLLYNVCGNASCQSRIPLHISECQNCSTLVRTKVCTQCFRYTRNFDDTCPYSDCKHVVTNPPKYIPCILCLTLLEVTSDYGACHVCKTRQDYSVWQKMTYKACPNSKCAVILPFKCMECYRCGTTVDQSPAISSHEIKWENRRSNLLKHLKAFHKQADKLELHAQYPAGYCAQCFKPIPAEYAVSHHCPSCDHVLVNAPQSIPCIVCSQMLGIDDCDVCIKCKTQQDYSSLQNMSFRRCYNTSSCDKVLPIDLGKCCFCSWKQSKDIIDPVSFRNVPVNSTLLEHLKSRPSMIVEKSYSVLCPQCFQPILNMSAIGICTACKHVLGDQPKYISCIICSQKLIIDNSDECFKCTTPQDYCSLQTMSFKVCLNDNCKCKMPHQNMICYHCNSEQTLDSDQVDRIPLDKLHSVNKSLLEHLKAKASLDRPTSHGDQTHEQLRLEKKSMPCPWCFELVSESSETCPLCAHVLVPRYMYIPCVVCNNMLELDNSDKCGKCTTQQYYSVLQGMKFKSCCNDFCKCLIPFDITECCFCFLKQSDVQHDEQSNESIHCFDKITNFFKPELLKYLKQKAVDTSAQHPNVKKLVTEEESETGDNKDDYNRPQQDRPQASQSEPDVGFEILPADAEEKPSQKLSPCKVSRYPAGFCDKNDPDQMCVTFKTIVPKILWNWDEHSEIYMRFGGKLFGNFQYDFGPGEVDREEEQFLWFKFCHYFKSKHMRDSHCSDSHCRLQYKYTVFTDQVTKLCDIFEVPQEVNCSAFHTNRILALEHSNCQPTKRIVQFDTFVCPAASNVKDENMTSFFGSRKVWRSFSTKVKGMPSVHLNEMFKVCLTLFLLPMREMILHGNYGGDFNLSSVLFRVLSIVKLLHERKYMYNDIPTSNIHVYVFNNVIKQEAEKWIEDILLHLESNKKSVQIPVCGAFVILSLLAYLNHENLTDLKPKSVLRIFKIAAGSSRADDPEQVHERLQSLENFSKQDQTIILQYVIQEFEQLVDSFKKKTVNLQVIIILMKILPFIHSLRMTEVELGVYSVIDKDLNLVIIKQSLKKVVRFQPIIDEVQPFIEVDPLLSYNLLFLCPTNHFCLLSDVVLLELFIGALAQNIPRDYDKELVINPLLEIHKKTIHEKFEQHRITNLKVQLTKVSEALLAKAQRILLDDTKAYCIFCIVFTTFCCKNEDLPVDSKISGFLDKWIEKIYLDKTFGNTQRKKVPHKEPQLWNCILEDPVIVALIDDQSIKDKWTSIVKCILKSRLSKIRDEDAFGLFKVVDEGNNSELLCSVILDRISIALDNMFETNPVNNQKLLFCMPTSSDPI